MHPPRKAFHLRQWSCRSSTSTASSCMAPCTSPRRPCFTYCAGRWQAELRSHGSLGVTRRGHCPVHRATRRCGTRLPRDRGRRRSATYPARTTSVRHLRSDLRSRRLFSLRSNARGIPRHSRPALPNRGHEGWRSSADHAPPSLASRQQGVTSHLAGRRLDRTPRRCAVGRR